MDMNNVEKIEWKLLGHLTRMQNVWGKIIYVRICPNCNEKICLIFRNKGRFKISCPKCNYMRVDKKIDSSHYDNFKNNKLIFSFLKNIMGNKNGYK